MYLDWTSDNVLFYVGYGDETRIKNFKRNRKHKHVSKKHGIIRKILWFGESEKCAQAIEIRLISEFHTFVDDPLANKWVCNFTAGGEGASPSISTRAKIGAYWRGKSKSTESNVKRQNALLGIKQPNISAAKKGRPNGLLGKKRGPYKPSNKPHWTTYKKPKPRSKPNTLTGRKRPDISVALRGKPKTPAHCEALSKARKGIQRHCSICGQIGHNCKSHKLLVNTPGQEPT